MDIVSILVSLNKISLVALMITLGFVFYQVYLLKKETDSKRKNLVIPEFKPETGTTYTHETKILIPENKKLYIKSSMLPIIIGIILFIVFGIIFVVGLLNSKSKEKLVGRSVNPTPIIDFVASRGIKTYDQNWVELPDTMLKKAKPGTYLFLTIESVKNTDIDMARIRVNKNIWTQNDITVKYNKQLNVFYRDYIISTGEAFLKIEAQLHSKTDGWLGD
jgi:hypothetical protein